MALPKLFQRIFWHNNTTPALNEDNLNAMSKAIDDIDDRVIEREGAIMESVANAHTYMINAQDAAEEAAGSASSANASKIVAQAAAESAATSAATATTQALKAEEEAAKAKEYRDEAEAITSVTDFWVDFNTGLLMYTNGDIFDFWIDSTSGNLLWRA